MNKVIRSSTLNKSLMTRGGHGIARPDPPLNHQYVHKRIISPFDTGMWMFCRSNPEYTFSNPEQHMQDHWYTLRVWLKVAPYWILVTAGLGAVYYMLTGYRPDGYSLKSDECGAINKQDMRLSQKYIANDHFLFPNLNLTETASQKVMFDKDCNANRQVSLMKESLVKKRAINAEGKNFAQNLLKKAEDKIDKQERQL